MARRSNQSDPLRLLGQLQEWLTGYPSVLDRGELREQILSLVPAAHLLRDLGSSLIPTTEKSARDRILYYLAQYPNTVIGGDELMVVGGIGEWARRVRELRVELGWRIITGVSVSEMAQEEMDDADEDLPVMSVNDYMLLSTTADRDAAYRWNIANEIRKKKGLSIRDKILEYLRANTSKEVSGDELRYVAGDKTEWARRVRELRTEFGWPVVTKQTGMPELPVGTYLLELDRQAPPHDRTIPDPLRRKVLRRDGFSCQECSWHINEYNRADPRILELHHKRPHASGGENSEDNLVTLCNVCHDEVHSNVPGRQWRFM